MSLLSPPTPLQSTPSLWRNRNYLRFLFGQTVSQLGSQVSQFAFPLLVLALTRDPAWAGVAGGLVAVPYLFLSLPAGALLDRWDRKRVLILCDLGRFCCLISIPLAMASGHLTLLQLCLTSTLEGTFFTFFNLAEVACLPRLVSSEEHLSDAVTANEVARNTTTALGPAIGGILLGIGRAVPFLADALSYGISVITLFRMNGPLQNQRHERSPHSLMAEIREGIRWTWQQSLLRLLVILACVGNGLANGLLLLFLFLANTLHTSPPTIGIFYALAGICSLLGALLAGPLQRRFPLGQILLTTQWANVALFPLYLFATRNIILLTVVTAALTFFGSLEGIVQFTYRLSRIPDELQGRVNSVFRLVAYAGAPLGFFAIGFLLHFAGTTMTILVVTLVVFLLAGITTLNPHIRHATSV